MGDKINFNIKDILKNLTPEEQQAVFKILNEYAENGDSQTLEAFEKADYEEVPVDIDEFLDNDDYLGKGIWETDEATGERRCTLFPYWRETLHRLFPTNTATAYNTLILAGAIGLGKAQPMSSKILTQRGFILMKDLKLTDLVYGNDGKLHNLLGIFPQGIKPIYKVTFSDGTYTECSDQHLWTVYNIKHKKWDTFELKEFISGKRKLRLNNKQYRYKIPITAPIDFKKQQYFIHPYILGALLGDGCLTYNNTVFASIDEEIINNIEQKLQPGYFLANHTKNITYSICTQTTQNQYTKELNNLGLKTTAEHKFIPDIYKYGSIEDRIELLQGLMDTDGSISKNGAAISYCTCSEQLKNDFIFLIQSLGGVCKVSIKPTYYKNKDKVKINGKQSYFIRIKLPKNICPFKLQRKKNRINENALEPSRYITNIEYLKDDECQCIYIDSKEHLYLTDSFIVTHNTLMAVICQLYLLYRMLCLKDPYAYYKLMPMDKITFSMLNVNLEAAKGVAWDKLQQFVQMSPWFQMHGHMNASRVSPQWQPDKHIELLFGSNNNHVVGRALFCLDGETEILTDGGLEKLKNLVDKKIKVWAVDNNKNLLLSNTCTVKPTVQTTEEYKITLEDGSIIKCTPNHRLMLKDGSYKEAQYLTEDDELAEIQSYFMNRDYVVYSHVNKINGKKYFGVTCNSVNRRWQNGNGYKNNLHFYKAIKKYGWNNFEHKIIQKNLTKDEAYQLEDKFIKEFNTTDTKFGYNIAYGGGGNPKYKTIKEKQEAIKLQNHQSYLKRIYTPEKYTHWLELNNKANKKRLANLNKKQKQVEKTKQIKSEVKNIRNKLRQIYSQYPEYFSEENKILAFGYKNKQYKCSSKKKLNEILTFISNNYLGGNYENIIN